VLAQYVLDSVEGSAHVEEILDLVLGDEQGHLPHSSLLAKISRLMRVLVIDNYDSFTYNLVQYLGELEAEVLVRRNDEVSPEEVAALHRIG
jgi:hypothetical protein